MSGVKRFEAHYLTDGVMGGKALARAEMVLASDYDRLEQELKRLKADRSACWAEFKVMTRSCLDAEKERNEARAERDALRAQVESFTEKGSVQIYPGSALEPCEEPGECVAVPRELATRLCHTDNYTRQMARRELRNQILAQQGKEDE